MSSIISSLRRMAMGESILVVDDERPVRDMLGHFLEGQGHAVTHAESAQEALEAVERASPDLVITDLKMPGMDGLALAQKLLEQDSHRPVLLMTAYADLDSARRAVSVGVYEFFTKPFDLNDVAAGVRRALERRRPVLENQAYQKDLERKVEERTRELMHRLKELEARDGLLRHMLSIQAPEKTLGLAVKLALDLCACDAGALYVPVEGGKLALKAAVGFAGAGACVEGKDLPGLGLEDTPEAARIFPEILENRVPVWEKDAGSVRRGFGIHSFGVLPVTRGDQVIALLEVDRKRKDILVGEADLEALQGFLSYVALAVLDCKLQEELPEWEGDVEEMLRAAEEWGE